MPRPKREIPPERRAIYYLGMALVGIGVLLFLSTFVTAITNFGKFDGFENFRSRAQSSGVRAFGGIGLCIVGRLLMSLGVRGFAGSGVILDPQKAREDLEPWNRMEGGILDDKLSEIGLVQKLEDRLEDDASSSPNVKVRCRNCRHLNDESAKYCNQCGAAI